MPAEKIASGLALRTISGCAACVIAAIACGQSRPDWPRPVVEAVADAVALCTAVGGQPWISDAVRRADLTGDRRDDFVFFVGWARCDGAVGVFGDRQKGVVVFVAGRAGSPTEAFRDWVYDAVVEDSDVPATLWLTTSGEACGRPAAADFASETFCARPLAWNSALQRFDYAPLTAARIVE